jgi:hypothetical protein
VISVHIKAGRTPHVLAVFSFRYDAHLVPALVANIDPLVDGWIAYDDRGGSGLFSDEVRRRTALLEAARETGAGWALAVDPDERFESALSRAIGRLTAARDAPAYTFALREMFTPDHFRVDGVWGEKRQARLLPIAAGVAAPKGNLHLSWSTFVPDAKLRDTNFNLYHLKMITPERRKARAALYNYLDPDGRMQRIGYDYLDDEAGLQLQRIASGREYQPPHAEDGGLWMPPLPPRD